MTRKPLTTFLIWLDDTSSTVDLCDLDAACYAALDALRGRDEKASAGVWSLNDQQRWEVRATVERTPPSTNSDGEIIGGLTVLYV